MKSTGHLSEERVDDLADLAEGALLTEASEVEALLREAEVHKLRIAYQWAIAHPALDACETPAGPTLPAVLTAPESLGGPGTPTVAAFTPEPLAVALGCSPTSASALLADTLDLHHRLPLLWDHARAQLVPVWKARRVATRTRHLSFDAARWLDRQVAGRVSSLGVPALDRLVAEAAARCDGGDLTRRESSARDTWDVVLTHPDPLRSAGTSELCATGDTLDLTPLPRRRLRRGRSTQSPGRHRRARDPQGQGTRCHCRRPGQARPHGARPRRGSRRPPAGP